MTSKTGGARASIAKVARIHAVIIPSVLSLIVVAIWFPLELREFEAQRSRYREGYVETRRELLQSIVDQLAAAAPALSAEASASGVSNPAVVAQGQLIRLIGAVRSPHGGFAWAFTTDGAMIVHSSYNRQSRPQWYSPRAAELVRGVVKVATTTGGGFVESPWATQVSPGGRGLSYVRVIPQWRWVVGASVSLDDIDAAVAANQRSLNSSVTAQALATAVMLLVMLLFSWAWLHAFSRRISGSLALFQSFFESAARDRQPFDATRLRYSELRRIADSANAMIESQKESDRRLEHSEEEMRHKQKMEAVGRLAGVVAHDFNNMLAVILGYSETLLSSECLDEEALLCAREIQRTAHLAGTLTRQLLTFSRNQPSRQCSVNLNELVSAMTNMLQKMLGDTIELRTQLSPSLGMIRADPAQIQQVIMNLAVNSRDAMPTGGQILIASDDWTPSNPDETARAGAQGHFVRLCISDSGCGMDESVKKRLFEPFFTTKPPGKGTGLGLSIVYGVVTQAGGFLEVESSLGKGTTTKAYFPCFESTPSGSSSSSNESKRVLIESAPHADPASFAPRADHPLAFLR